MNEADKLIDELFDSLEDDEGTPTPTPKNDDEPSKEPAPPAGTNETKAYSERLKRDRDKLAKELGYES